MSVPADWSCSIHPPRRDPPATTGIRGGLSLRALVVAVASAAVGAATTLGPRWATAVPVAVAVFVALWGIIEDR